MKTSVLFLVLFLAYAVSGQIEQTPAISAEKKALINEIRQLTGLSDISATQNVDKSNFGTALTNWADKQTGLTDEQMRELKRLAQEGSDRVEGEIREFSQNTTMMTALLEKVTIDLYDQSFTENELKEMAAFYRTPTGKKEAQFTMKLSDRMSKTSAKLFSEKFKEWINGKMDEEFNKLRLKLGEMKKAQPIA